MSLYIQSHPYRRAWRRWQPAVEAQPRVQRLAVDVRDDEEVFTVTALVPGLQADDLNIQVLDDVVRIDGAFADIEGEYLMRELPAGEFRRTLRMPAPVDAAKVEARIENGVLTLRLPRAESARPKAIKIAVKK